ncbi:MAG: diacylglycerol kinase [Fimbriimonadaceae bacterium]|nr:diacylglycerol kinase [Fimbriimonadaceae bacterium]
MKDFLTPFRAAFNGVIHTFRTQRHMRIHLTVTLVTMLGALALGLSTRELLILLFMITFVLVAEMFNSAIEATVDLISPNYHPLAKFAKDIAAGAVLVTTVMAILVGAVIMVGDEQWERIRLSLTADTIGAPVMVRIIAGTLAVIVAVTIGKGLGRHGRVLQGGQVSGHSALGFFFATCVFFLADNAIVAAISVLLAGIIAQSRYEAKFHSLFELTLGAFVGIVVGVVLFGLTPK